MKYKYQAKTKSGELQVGFVEARNQEAAVSILTGHELFIMKLEEQRRHWYDRVFGFLNRVRRKDMVVFTRQFATLLEARLPLSRSLTTLYEQTVNQTLKEAIFETSQDVNSGLSLSQALERREGVFSDFFVSMIRSAEVTGNLDRVMGFLADHVEKEDILVSKTRAALLYPIIILIVFLMVALVLIIFVFPQLKPIFEEAGVELPIFTRILLGSGAFFATWWPLCLGIFVVASIGIADYARTPEGKALTDDMKIRLPIIRRLTLPVTIARFANAATILIKGGIPVAQAMEIVGETVDNILYRDVLREISIAVREGRTLSESISAYPMYFPALVSQMLAVGETTGQLEQMLDRISTFYNREADGVIGNMVDIIQPALMVVIGVMVGFLFASILIPLYRLTSSIH